MKSRDRIERALWRTVVFLALIGIAAVVRRALVLIPALRDGYHASANPLDAGFARQPILTLVHIIPGFLFMVLGPLQLVRPIRARTPWLHRWSGRLFVASGVVIGLSALAMSWQMAIGGASETAATTLFALLFLWALGKGFLHIRRREFAQHREWMIRAFAIGLAVATIRPIVGIFFATSRLTHLTPREFFGAAFWLGFTLHLIAAEAWIRYTREMHATGSLSSGCVTSPVTGQTRDRHSGEERRNTMKLMLLAIGLLLGVATMAIGENTQQQLMKLGDELAAAEQQGEVAFLDHTLMDDFILIGPRGFVLNKEQYLARYKSGALQPGTNERDQVHLRIYGDAAIMTAHEIAAGSYQGHGFRNELRSTKVFVKRNGHWLLAHAQLSPVLGAPPTAAR